MEADVFLVRVTISRCGTREHPPLLIGYVSLKIIFVIVFSTFHSQFQYIISKFSTVVVDICD